MKQDQSVLLVDGMSLLFRGFYATAVHHNFMRNSEGVPTNALFGFIRYMLDAISIYKPTHVICCWDTPQPTFRHRLYQGYKANRGAPPEELLPQFSLVQPLAASFGALNVEKEGYEADDIIGTLAAQLSSKVNVKILTSDQDSLQLVDDNVHAIIMKRGLSNYKPYTIATLYEDFGLYPKQIIDLKALMGDASDNYPGVKGIGEKTALKLLKQYESIEDILKNIDSLSKGVQTKLKNDLEMLHLSRKLATIARNVPVSVDVNQALWLSTNDQVFETITKHNLTSIVKLV